ncbi:MAG: hypothetical protein LBS62_11150 [Clostridiales bacterium]|jgi:DNA-directed RNA polymerase specialized sigma24 family protein|nr:hypothetical protein [Clostridiales bacterium]
MNDIVQIALLVAIVVGSVLVAAALVFAARSGRAGGSKDDSELKNDGLDPEGAIKAVEASIAEADKVSEDFQKQAASIFKEMDEKYQELLFLYSLIDEKKTDAAKMLDDAVSTARKAAARSRRTAQERDQNAERRQGSEDGETLAVQKHPRYKEIMQLIDSGLSISEAAKKLDMGQGEVKLIVELDRR